MSVFYVFGIPGKDPYYETGLLLLQDYCREWVHEEPSVRTWKLAQSVTLGSGLAWPGPWGSPLAVLRALLAQPQPFRKGLIFGGASEGHRR